MDSYYVPAGDLQTYYFADIQDRFFVAWSEPIANYEYSLSLEDFNKYAKALEEGEYRPLPNYEKMVVPVCKIVYVPPRNRGKQLQHNFFDFAKSIADTTGESFALYCDPFTINNVPSNAGAKASLGHFFEDGIDHPENWLTLTVKQRDRFTASGFRNVKYKDGEQTMPFQQFFYLSEKATQQERELVDSLEVFYDVDRERLRKLEAG